MDLTGTMKTVDWDQKLQQTMVEMFPLRTADAAYNKISGMLSTLGDPFTRIISPKVLQFTLLRKKLLTPWIFIYDTFIHLRLARLAYWLWTLNLQWRRFRNIDLYFFFFPLIYLPSGIPKFQNWKWWEFARGRDLYQRWAQNWPFGSWFLPLYSFIRTVVLSCWVTLTNCYLPYTLYPSKSCMCIRLSWTLRWVDWSTNLSIK